MGGIFITSSTTVGFSRWPLLHDFSRFVSACNIDVRFLLPHFYLISKTSSCFIPHSFSLYFYFFDYYLFVSSSFTELYSSCTSLFPLPFPIMLPFRFCSFPLSTYQVLFLFLYFSLVLICLVYILF